MCVGSAAPRTRLPSAALGAGCDMSGLRPAASPGRGQPSVWPKPNGQA